jgi:hypothetical protein
MRISSSLRSRPRSSNAASSKTHRTAGRRRRKPQTPNAWRPWVRNRTRYPPARRSSQPIKFPAPTGLELIERPLSSLDALEFEDDPPMATRPPVLHNATWLTDGHVAFNWQGSGDLAHRRLSGLGRERCRRSRQPHGVIPIQCSPQISLPPVAGQPVRWIDRIRTRDEYVQFAFELGLLDPMRGRHRQRPLPRPPRARSVERLCLHA